MVKFTQSIIPRLYLTMALLFSVVGPISFFGGIDYFKNDKHHEQDFREHFGRTARYITDELAEASQDQRPIKLKRLEQALNVRIKLRDHQPQGHQSIHPHPQGPPPFFWGLFIGKNNQSKTIWGIHEQTYSPKLQQWVDIKFIPPQRGKPPFREIIIIYLLLLGLLLLPLFQFWLIRPLKNLQKLALHLANGDLNTPIISTRQDEYGELEKTFEQMRQEILTMLQNKEKLLWSVSHEIRGPLGRIKLIQAHLKNSFGEEPMLSMLKDEIDELNNLLEALLTLSRQKDRYPNPIETIDLPVACAGLIQKRQLQAQAQQITLNFKCPIQEVSLPWGAIQTVLNNLLDNAIKYTPALGTVELAIEQNNHQLIFKVQDSGPGIDFNQVDRYFDAFYRPDESRTRATGGHGLGLSIVKAIADNLNAQVLLTPRDDKKNGLLVSFIL
jgi:signal transduction histidine kinase